MNRSMRRIVTLIVCLVVAVGGVSRPGAWYVPALAATGNLTYGGGPVMPNPKNYVIFWLPGGRSFEPSGSLFTDTNMENLVTKYFGDVCGNPLYNTLTQYSTNNNTTVSGGPIQNTCSYGGSYVDTTAFPTHFDGTATIAGALNFSDLSAAVDRAVTQFSGGGGTNVEYFLYLPYQVNWCTSNTFCSFATDSNNGYCAFHSTYTGGVNGSTRTVYSVMSPAFGGCSVGTSPNNTTADSYINDTEHEQFESVSDVQGNAWNFGGTAGENGDQCNFNFGSADKNSDGANFVINGHRYRMQWEWSNAISGCAPSLCGTSVCQAVPTFNMSAVTATIPGNPGDDAQVNVSASNTSGFDGVYNALASVPAPSGFSSGGPTKNFGAIAVKQSVGPSTLHYTPSTWLPAGATYTFNGTLTSQDQLGNNLSPLTGSVTITIVNAPPTLDPVPDQTTIYHDAITPFTLAGHDTDAGDSLYYDATGLPSGLSINHNTGIVSGTPTAAAGIYTVTYSVTDHHNAAVTQTANITVDKEDTTLTYTGDTVIAQGSSTATLSARLLEDGNPAIPIAGRSVDLALGTGAGAQHCSPMPVTNASGVASCTLTNITVPQGPEPVTATFAGDAYYLGSSDSKTVIVFAFLANGSFTLGDKTVTAATPTTTVTWWGANWSSLNSLSSGAAPDAFKGFAGTTSTTPPVCGGTWTSRPGNSSGPPDPSAIPSYMGVAVPTGITTKAGTISGNVSQIVVVKTDAGYDGNPGHDGTGTIVATYCH
jgi:hypothetical protein